MKKPRLYYIHKYEVWQEYGGPEEDNWYYEVGVPVSSYPVKVYLREERAYAFCRYLNEKERERAKHEEPYDYSSVLASQSNHYSYHVDETYFAEPYPLEKPHYE